MLDVTKREGKAPFDTARLDRLMDEAGIDVLVTTSKHNVQYLLGGHRAFFFESMDAMGLSRYLPVFVYAKGAPDKAGFFGHRMENFQNEVKPFWVSEIDVKNSGSVDVMEKAVDYIRKLGPKPKRLGAELAFIPADSMAVLRKAFPDSEIKDALFVLERLRALKTPEELEKLRIASDLVINSMLAVIASHGAGATKAELSEALRREETYARADIRLLPDRGWLRASIALRQTSAGKKAIRCRSIPAATITAISATWRAWQWSASRTANWSIYWPRWKRSNRRRCSRSAPGVLGKEIYAAADAVLHKSKLHNHTHFLAHGMGLVSHEAPRLTNSGPVPYDAYDADRPLEAGMVVSVETTLQHPRRGFIKLEDTVVVTPSGFQVYGDRARGWNRAGSAAS